MIIRASELDPEGVRFDVPLQIGPLTSDADEEVAVEGVVLTGHAWPTSRGLTVRGRLKGAATLPCARCCGPFTLTFDRELSLVYAFAAASPPGHKEIQIPEVELDYDFLDAGGALDLKQLAVEQIYLELPMKPLCRPACKGLCKRCGASLNKDFCLCEDNRPVG